MDATTSVDATLKLSRDYNHVYVALKKDPSIQYAYKVTGEAGLLNWKNTNSELHLVGLSAVLTVCISAENGKGFSPQIPMR